MIFLNTTFPSLKKLLSAKFFFKIKILKKYAFNWQFFFSSLLNLCKHLFRFYFANFSKSPKNMGREFRLSLFP